MVYSFFRKEKRYNIYRWRKCSCKCNLFDSKQSRNKLSCNGVYMKRDSLPLTVEPLHIFHKLSFNHSSTCKNIHYFTDNKNIGSSHTHLVSRVFFSFLFFEGKSLYSLVVIFNEYLIYSLIDSIGKIMNE